ncbi:DUF3159 domain-containing protein [Streptomyces parvulus]|uniref:DUF3159 domain-containing protein n=1 Tax=Streptomyces parvulus TaxID=146923 RepID=UPI0015F06489|nr:DUF3159 domain-containing protein [Streptomyces parvulus]
MTDPDIRRSPAGTRPRRVVAGRRSFGHRVLGRGRGLVLAVLPAAAFAAADACAGLRAAVTVSIVVSVGVAADLLVRGASMRPALAGLLGVVVAVGTSLHTGTLREYLVVSVWIAGAAAALFGTTVLIGQRLPMRPHPMGPARGREAAVAPVVGADRR